MRLVALIDDRVVHLQSAFDAPRDRAGITAAVPETKRFIFFALDPSGDCVLTHCSKKLKAWIGNRVGVSLTVHSLAQSPNMARAESMTVH